LRQFRIALIVLLVAAGLGRESAAQSLSLSIFGSYLDSLRQQAGIPGMSAAIVQHGAVVWERGFGKQDLGANIDATPITPYPIAGLSQAIGSTLLLEKCVDQSYLATSDKVVAWNPAFAEPTTSIRDLLTHAAPTGGYHFDLGRFAALTPIVERCAGAPYRKVIAKEIFDRLAMIDTVPDQALATPSQIDLQLFDNATLQRYAQVLSRLAVPYRVDRGGRASRSDPAPQPLDMATGIVSTVRDLANFDGGLTRAIVVSGDSLAAAWTPPPGMPTGLGWFVQNYNGLPVVWQFGMVKDAYSSLVLKLPTLDVTVYLLANSDGLASPFALENGDVTTSVFAKLFLRFATGQ
jgi:CubicO group peptidase (beta-lactamase class C family)